MKILDFTVSDSLRRKYVDTFVDVLSAYYIEHIKHKTIYSDGLCYTGYLWDCLINPHIIEENSANSLLKAKENVLIMWDIHSCERIFVPDYWKYPKTSVIYTKHFDDVSQSLPEDVYVFDDSFTWSVVYTHETNANGSRYCLLL